MAFCSRLLFTHARGHLFSAVWSWLRKERRLNFSRHWFHLFCKNARRLLARSVYMRSASFERFSWSGTRSMRPECISIHACWRRVMRSINIENSDAENMDLMHLRKMHPRFINETLTRLSYCFQAICNFSLSNCRNKFAKLPFAS